jgi:hypothetical protein
LTVYFVRRRARSAQRLRAMGSRLLALAGNSFFAVANL